MELKLIKSLNDIPTLTELAILTLYGKQVSSTYMKYIQGKKMINHLTLGPFHQKLLNFLDCLIDTPNLISDNPNDKLHFLKGKSYSDSLAVKAVLALAPQLLHLSGLFKAFLVGTRPVWACFSSEFDEGGLIDQATEEEQESAWMPATNDKNEAILREGCITMWNFPGMAIHLIEAQKKFHHNHTQAFMDHFLA